MTMRILHVIPHLDSGGADRAAAAMVRGLQLYPSLTMALCVLNGRRVLPERSTGISELFLLEFDGSLKKPLNLSRNFRRFRKVVAQWRPDIVHSHLWPACRFSAAALIGSRVGQVWHAHDTRSWLKARDLRSRLYRHGTRVLVHTLSPRMVAVSRAVATATAQALCVGLEEISVIPNAVDLEEFDVNRFTREARGEGAAPVIGLAAQFRPEKGHRVLVRACAHLRRRGIAFQLQLAGAGRTRAQIEQEVLDLQLAECTEFLGPIADVPGFLSGLDLFVLPSTDFEGLPLCVLEALAMRVPVVATDVAGTSEAIRDGETGLLVPPGDEHALASAMERILWDKDLAARAVEQGFESMVTEFSLERQVQDVVAFYARAKR